MLDALQIYARPLDAGQDDGAAGLGRLDRLRNRLDCFSSDINHHVRTLTICDLPYSFDHIVIGKNRLIGAELSRQLKSMGALAPRND